MKNILLLTVLSTAYLMTSCGGSGNESDDTSEGEENDSSQVEVIEDEATELAFDGVDREGYTLYGHTDVDAADAVSSGDMMTSWEATGEFYGKVNVQIDEVCQKAGCWMTYIDDFGTNVRVYFRDHFTIPIETAQGTEVVLYGAVYDDTISVDWQKHLMEDALEDGEELDEEAVAALQPKTETAFDCESVLIKKN